MTRTPPPARACSLLLCFLLLAGCATVTPPLADYSKEARYKPVSVVVNDGKIDTSYASVGYAVMAIVDETSMVLKEELTNTGMFEFVELNNPYQEVVLVVDFKRKVTDENFAKSVFQGATLFLVPTSNKFKTTTRIAVRVRAEIVKTYEYEMESTQRMFLADDPYAERRGIAKALWSRFLADAQKDQLFENLVPAALQRQKGNAGD